MNQVKLFTLALALAFVLPGCGKKEEGQNPDASTVTPAKQLKLAFVANSAATFWTIARAGTQDAAKELGNLDVYFHIPGSGTAAEQRQIMDDLLAKGVDGIAVSPIDAGNQTEFLDKVAGQTLLICHDSDAPASKRVCYIGTDNFAAGIEGGQIDQGSAAQRRQDHGVRRLCGCAKRHRAFWRHQKGTGRLEHRDHRPSHR